MEPKFNVEGWLKTIDVWDQKYDYVKHNDHWLTSEWSSKCEKCLMKGNKPAPKPMPNSSPLQQAASISLNSTASNTLKNESPISSSPPPNLRATQPPPTEHIIPVTPIAPSHLSSRAFVTPHTSMKFNDTFTRSTRQSTRKLLNQNANNYQDLINLNETFDLYKSALAETPGLDAASTSTNGRHDDDKANNQQQLLNLTSTNGSSSTVNNVIATPLTFQTTNNNSRMVPPKPRSNFELLTNNQTNVHLDFTPASIQEAVDNHHAFSQPTASRITRIPRIPVRSSRQNEY